MHYYMRVLLATVTYFELGKLLNTNIDNLVWIIEGWKVTETNAS